MGPVPQLSTYEQAAQSIYEPQKQAEMTQLGAVRDTTKNTLEGEKGQVNTDYQTAINNLKDTITQQSGQIQQLYTQRLLGNISGLQGNDMGAMFARANQQEATIESTRANKLASIATAEGNADIKYNAGVAALTPKYMGLEEKYAQSAYGTAVKDYQDNQYKQQQLELQQERINATNANTAARLQAAAEAKYGITDKSGVKGDSSGGYDFTGPNGEPINMAQYVQGKGGNGQDILNLLANGTSYDRNVFSKVVNDNAGKQAIQNEDTNALMKVVSKYDKGGYYGF